MGQYWKNYVWEYLMCVLAAATLLLNTAQGFYIPDALADQIPMAVALCAALMLLFFLGGYNKVGLVLTPVLTAAVIVLCFFLLRARGVDIVDQEGSDSAAYIYWFAFAIICLTVYLCSRSRIGVAVLFLIGCCVSAGLQFMEYQVFAWAGLLFAISCMVLFLLRQYRAQAMTSSTAAPDFFRFFRSTLALVAAGGILSAGIFFAVIRPLDPPTVDLQFLERYLAFQILEHTGISDSYSLPDQEQFTDRQDDTLDETDQTTQGETPLDQSADTPYETPEPQPDAWERPAGQERLSAVSYTLTPVWRVVLWCVLIALILILPPALRLVWRRHRMKQIQALEPGAQIQAIIENIETVIVGKHASVELVVLALLARGHVLIEDVPGVGKTSLVSAVAKSVDCGYDGFDPILRGVSFTVEAGQICCLLGPNGVGKTTLFKTVLGILKPRSGFVEMNGENTAHWSARKLTKNMAYVSQFHNPPFPYKVRDVVLLGRVSNTGYFGQPTEMDYEIAEAAMADMGITHLRDTVYTDISGGERQLVMIARALAQEPQLLVMDEPTANLDYGNMVRVMKKIRSLRDKGFGVIMTTHSPDQAFMCESTVCLLQRDRPLVFGFAHEVITQENMRQAYGVDVKVIEFFDVHNRLVRMCSPLFDE